MTAPTTTPRTTPLSTKIILLLLFTVTNHVEAFLTPPAGVVSVTGYDTRLSIKNNNRCGTFDRLLQRRTRRRSTLYERKEENEPIAKSKIPTEYRDEIYLAESRTAAAQGRNSRTAAYAAAAILGLLLGLGNVVLTTTKNVGMDLEGLGYGWTQSIWFLSNTFGGYFDIILAGVFGTLVELENRTRDETAEKIWEEMERRRQVPQKKKEKVAKKQKKRRQSRRLAALAEVILEDEEPVVEEKKPVEEEKKGLFGKAKEFYQRADSMAASQALLLNKELEERGVLDKITDESGLTVIGKHAVAAKKGAEGKEGPEETGIKKE